MSPVEIRLCKSSDLPEVIDLMVELSGVAHSSEDFQYDNVKRVFDDMQKHPEMYMNLVAVLSGKVAGFISVIFYKTVFHKGGTALINELIITGRERGKGIGGQLIKIARDEALKRGMDEIEVGTEKSNYPAQKFYKKCGFDEEYLLLGMEF